MEWVETTGRTVAAALDSALDELGVDEQDVEYEVLEEGRAGLLGRRDARVRARVKPLSREKPSTRRGGRTRNGRGGEGGAPRTGGGAKKAPAKGAGRGTSPKGGGSQGGGRKSDGSGDEAGTPPRKRGSRAPRGAESPKREVSVEEMDIPVEEQGQIALDFARGLTEAFGVDAAVALRVEDDTVLVDITGDDLGLLVGARGVTLQAIEELVRTVVHRRTEGRGARINVDVTGYRAQRRAALEEFAVSLAERVRESGREQALEPMSAADRKVVHDAIAPLDDVATSSEGEEPRRRVVVRRA